MRVHTEKFAPVGTVLLNLRTDVRKLTAEYECINLSQTELYEV